MTHKLAKMPLVEAICELHLLGGADEIWTEPQAKALQDALAPAYSRPLGFNTSDRRAQLTSEDGAAILQLRPNLLVINQVARYDGWLAFRSRIVNAFAACTAGSPQLRPAQLLMSYLNLFDYEGPASGLETILSNSPRLNEKLGYPIVGFQTEQHMEIPSPPGFLTQRIGTGESDGFGQGIILELTFTSSDEIPGDGLLGYLDQTHAVIWRTFKASLTDRMNDMLPEGNG